MPQALSACGPFAFRLLGRLTQSGRYKGLAPLLASGSAMTDSYHVTTVN
jgi:hypothetical protein